MRLRVLQPVQAAGALLLVLALSTGCAVLRGERSVGSVLGATSGDGPAGVVIGAAVLTLADQVEAGGTRRPPDPVLASQLRAVDTSAVFIYGLRYDGCTRADPELVAKRKRTVEARTRDLNRACYVAEPVTAYFAVEWDDLAGTFTIGSPNSAAGQTRVQDRRVV